MKKTPPAAADSPAATNASHATPHAGSDWARSVRDTVEAIAIAFALAFLFKTFEAEAFVIPTGSMAPTLMGRHKDVTCPECGYRYSASGSEETERDGSLRRTQTGAIDENCQIVECSCPICRYPMSVDPQDPGLGGEHPSYSGDRIWVSKIPYHFSEPRRWDVIVFRFPMEAETYYIKRLIGLPNEKVKIFHGDIYTKTSQDRDFLVARKPPEKIQAMAQVVHDNDYTSARLAKAGWPARWHATPDGEKPGGWKMSDNARTYSVDGASPGEEWIRYKHLVPSESYWRDVEDGRSPAVVARPQLITDFYAFNTRVQRKDENYGMIPSALGLHWVGDLIVDCTVDVHGSKGAILLDLVKGGRHFRATIDVASGRASLSIDGLPDWRRTGETAIRGHGKHQLMFANVDRQLVLWVDGKVVPFDQPATYDELDDDRPDASRPDGGDLAPAGIGSRGAAVDVSHLRVLRDIYYIADNSLDGYPITDFRSPSSNVPILRTDDLVRFLSTPSEWQRGRGGSVFDDRQAVTFELETDQFFVLGDNSPASSDARFWPGEHYVKRDLLVGKALFIYWPHAIDLPIPMTNSSIPIVPNVPDMQFIR